MIWSIKQLQANSFLLIDFATNSSSWILKYKRLLDFRHKKQNYHWIWHLRWYFAKIYMFIKFMCGIFLLWFGVFLLRCVIYIHIEIEQTQIKHEATFMRVCFQTRTSFYEDLSHKTKMLRFAYLHDNMYFTTTPELLISRLQQ